MKEDKKKKVKLDSIQVKSFITEADKIKGGLEVGVLGTWSQWTGACHCCIA